MNVSGFLSFQGNSGVRESSRHGELATGEREVFNTSALESQGRKLLCRFRGLDLLNVRRVSAGDRKILYSAGSPTLWLTAARTFWIPLQGLVPLLQGSSIHGLL